MRIVNFSELSDEQLEIVNIPLHKNCLVTGAPGTGKTLVALMRAQALKKRAGQSTFVVFNRLLELYLRQAIQHYGVGSTVGTYHSWICKLALSLTSEPMPGIASESGWSEPDLEAFLDKVTPVINAPGGVPATKRHSHLLIDEAQDLPPVLFDLVPHVAQAFSVFADENQRMNDDRGSDLRDLVDALGLEPRRLTRNFRNTREIHQVAAVFAGPVASNLADPPDDHWDRPVAQAYRSRDEQIRHIVDFARVHKNQEIGVLLPRRDLVIEFQQCLSEQLDCPVAHFVSGMPKTDQMPFDGPGVRVLTYQSAKGLEFDTVFLPCLDAYDARLPENDDRQRRRFYVQISRARRDLFFLWQQPTPETPLPDVIRRILAVNPGLLDYRPLYNHSSAEP